MSVSLEPVSPPPTVFLPAAAAEPGPEGYLVELRQVDDVLVVVAFSSLEALVRGCGLEQPWVAMRAEDVDDLREQWAAAAVILDPVLDDARDEPGAESPDVPDDAPPEASA